MIKELVTAKERAVARMSNFSTPSVCLSARLSAVLVSGRVARMATYMCRAIWRVVFAVAVFLMCIVCVCASLLSVTEEEYEEASG